MQEEKIQTLRLSPQQRRLWLLKQDGSAFCAQSAIGLEGRLDVSALKNALRNTIARHEILRTTIRLLSGVKVPFQVVIGDLDPGWRVLDWRAHSLQEQQKSFNELFEEELCGSFDLEHGPIVRASLIELGAQRHLLLLSLSALHADGRSLSILLQELSRAYAAWVQCSGPTDEPVQFAQFSEWQHELLRDEGAEEGQAYWSKQDFQTPLQTALPFEEKPAARVAFRPQVHAARLKPELWHEARDLALRSDTSVANVMFAAWQALLWQLVGKDNLVIGQVADGRKYTELENALGPFAKLLPIPSLLTNDRSFKEALNQLKISIREAQSWQEYFIWEPRATPEPDSAEPDFFPFAFEFEWRSEPQLAAGVEFSVHQQRSYPDRFKLKAHAIQLDEALALELHYDPSYYTAVMVARLAGYFETLLSSALKNPEALLSELETLGAADRRELLEIFNCTDAPYPQDECIHHLLEEQAARHPKSVAVSFAGRRLTYEQLNESSNQLAHYLRALGVGPDVAVGICVERSIQMIVGILGILKAGGAYVPLDPTYPEDRISYILEDTQSPVLLTQRHLAENHAGRQARVICLDSDWEHISRESGENPSAGAGSDNLAYIIYTSGSTGKPKGVLISHQNLVHSTLARLTHYRDPVHCFLLLSSFSFDSSVAGIFWTLCQGGELCLPPEGAQLDIMQLASLIEENQVSHLLCLPSLYAFLIKLAKPRQLSSLSAVIVAGEACARELTETHHELMSQTSFFNEYGPTEATVWSSVYESLAEKPRRIVPIGLPIPNMRMHILDGQLRPVPIGVPGEVYIGGEGLARGYLHRPALTAERFIPDPFGKKAGARVYKTGDLARYLPDSNIEFLGRVDDQVKIRGYRIELGEIETVMREHEGVEEIVVIAREDEPGDQRIVAYVVPNFKHAAIVHGHLRYRLPNNMAVVHHHRNESDFLYRDIFEKRSYFKHGSTLREGAVVFDVGAHVGFFTMLVSQLGKDVKVYAFEPVPATFELLRINASLYGNDVKVFECGLSDKESMATFNFYPNFTMMSGRYTDAVSEESTVRTYMLSQFDGFDGRQAEAMEDQFKAQYSDQLLSERFGSESFNCRLRTLSGIIEEEKIECIDLLKIDVKRSEADVLAGIDGEHWKRIKQIVIELDDIDGRLNEISNLLKLKGYNVVAEQGEELGGTRLYKVYASRPSNNGNGQSHNETLTPPHFSHEPVLTSNDLRGFARERLPEYMVPSAFVILPEFQLLPNGKVNRRALPAPEQVQSSASSNYVPPGTEMEIMLASLWSEVLKVEHVGIHDNFFDLGGHSFLAIKAHHRLSQQLQIDIPLLKVFEHPTVHSLAQFLSDNQQPAVQSAEEIAGQSRDWAEKRKDALRRQRQVRGS